MTSQRTLATQFFNGATSGTASNVEIEGDSYGGAKLIGYGHALYAYRFACGTTVAFMGWYDGSNIRSNAGSQSTKSQYGTMGLRTDCDYTIEGTGEDAAPKRYRFKPEDLADRLYDEEGVEVTIQVPV